MHGIPSQWAGKDEGNGDPFHKIFVEHGHYFKDAGAVYFADSDFFGF